MTVAALYVESTGPYANLPGVDAWDEARDARNYAGPWPVVAHPPCAAWGGLRFSRLVHRNRADTAETDGQNLLAALAVVQVRRWGGVLEHPKASALWRHCDMPRPGELPDRWGGLTVEIDQSAWGHKATKATWLYVVRCRSPFDVRRRHRSKLTVENDCSKRERKLTPPALAADLVRLAASATKV